MRRLAFATLLLATVATASPFRFERAVKPGGPGANRLDVDIALLAGAQPDLRDLRLYDGSGTEVPYLLLEPPRREPDWKAASLLPIKETKNTSGFEADLGASTGIDRIRLAGITPPFLKRVTVEGSGDRAHWTLLADSTVFDLPERDLRNTDVSFTPGDYRYVRVTWDDRSSARVASLPTFTARIHGSGSPTEPLRASVSFARRASEPGKSRYHITLPGPHLPLTAIEVQVTGGDVFRHATITESRLGNGEMTPVALGEGQLKRAERGGAAAAEMEIKITPPQGRELDLVVDDGNNLPLPINRVLAVVAPQPPIYFESRDGAPLTARYGWERANRPQYDLEASRRFVANASSAHAVWADAPVTKPVNNASAAPPTPLGATVDPATFSIHRELEPQPAGYAVLTLDDDALARSHARADIRIIDAKHRQVPYVMERRDDPMTRNLPFEKTETRGTESVYHVVLPFERMPDGTKLVLRSNEHVFQRNVTLQADNDSATLAWSATDPELPAPSLTFDVPQNVRAFDIVVDEGDNARLPITTPVLQMPSYALRFYHPGGPLTVLYGNRDASEPRYDLALLAPRVMTEPARESRMLRPSEEAGHDLERNERKFFWIAIGIVAIALLTVLVRLLTTLTAEESAPLGDAPGRGDPPR